VSKCKQEKSWLITQRLFYFYFLATNFRIDPEQLHSDIQMIGDNSITCKNCEHRVVLGNTGFSRVIFTN